MPSRSQSRCIFDTEFNATAPRDARHRRLRMRDAHHVRHHVAKFVLTAGSDRSPEFIERRSIGVANRVQIGKGKPHRECGDDRAGPALLNDFRERA